MKDAGRPAANAVLRTLLAGSPFAQVVFEVGPAGELTGVTATRTAYETGLLLVDDVASRAVDEILRADSAWALRDGFRDALRLGGPTSYEEFVKVDGREVWWMTTVTSLVDDRGVPAYIVASFLELEFLKRAEAALLRLETSMRHLVEATSDAVLLTCADGRVSHANIAAAKLFGSGDARTLLGRPLDGLVRPVDPSASLAPPAGGGDPRSTQALAIALDVGIVGVEIVAIPILSDGLSSVLVVVHGTSQASSWRRDASE